MLDLLLIALTLQPTESSRVQELIRLAGRRCCGTEADRPAEGGTRITAIRELADLGARSKGAIPLMVRLAGDCDEMREVRVEALAALVKLDTGAAMPVLVRIASHPDENPAVDLSEMAMETLIEMGEQALPAIIDVFRKSDVTMDSTRDEQERFGRRMDEASQAVARIGKPAMPLLINALSEANESVRLFAATACEEMGPVAADAIPALAALLEDRSGSVLPFSAAHALGKIGPEAITSRVLELLSDSDQRVRHAVAVAVKELGPKGKTAVPAVVESLRTSSSEFTQEALAEALGAVGPDAAQACPVLVDMASGLRHEVEAPHKEVVRKQLLRTVEEALEHIGCVPQATPPG